MDKFTIPETIPERKLDNFKNYQEFLNYSQSLFDLSPEEYADLFKVMIKLENIGEDVKSTMQNCKYKFGEHDCLDMIRMLIKIEQMDLSDLKLPA